MPQQSAESAGPRRSCIGLLFNEYCCERDERMLFALAQLLAWEPQGLACAWVDTPTIIRTATDNPACTNKISNLSKEYCVGSVFCHASESDPEFQKMGVCQASGPGTCPSAGQCMSPGLLPDNSSRLKRPSTENLQTLRKKYESDTKPQGMDGAEYTFHSFSGLSTLDDTQGIVGFNYDESSGWSPTKSGWSVCIAAYSQSIQACKDDPCLVLGAQNPEIKDYAGTGGELKSADGPNTGAKAN